jgi:hypothetical protein
VVSAQKSSTTINLPSLQIGQRCGSSMLVVLASGSMGMGAADAASRARHWISFCLRTRLARKPKWRMRTKPEGSTWSRKRRMNSTASHGLGAGMVRVVFPVEADATVLQSAKPVVGDGHSVGIASQILEHASWSTEGRLDVNDPFELRGCLTHGLERGRLGQIAKLAGEVKPTFAKSPSQKEKEEFAEPAAEDLIRKEEGILPTSDRGRNRRRARRNASADEDAGSDPRCAARQGSRWRRRDVWDRRRW